jgi:hypothetical protein
MRDGRRPVRIAETDPRFARLVEETFVLLDRRGIFLRTRNPQYVTYWVGVGETPQQIADRSGSWSSAENTVRNQQRANL